MPYDPQGNGANPDDFLVRRGSFWESSARLAAQAAAARELRTEAEQTL